jgi:hypothetical protein
MMGWMMEFFLSQSGRLLRRESGRSLCRMAADGGESFYKIVIRMQAWMVPSLVAIPVQGNAAA